jgi:cobalt-zinc-cadmium efflux system outer membrane protein
MVGRAPGKNYVSNALQERTGHSLATSRNSDYYPPGLVNADQGLTESDAVAIALWNSPAYAELLADLGLSRAEVIKAGELKNPDLSILFPIGAKPLEYAINVPFESFLLRPCKIRLAEYQANQVAHRVIQDGLNFVRDVRVAHSQLLAAQEQLQIATTQEVLCERITKMAEARLRAGTTGELDVTTAKIEKMKASERSERAKYDVQIAQEQLRMLMGMGHSEISLRAVGQESLSEVPSDAMSLVDTALTSRPDIMAARCSVRAASKQAELAKWDFISVTGILSVKQNGTQTGPGMAATLPVFHRNEGSKTQAAWELQKASRHLESLQETVMLEVRRSMIQCEQAKTNWKRWNDEIIPESKKAVAISERAYVAGGDYLLNILLNSQQLLDAEVQRSQTANEMRCAVAELERSVGAKVVY